jgi:hypothetical protein
MKTGLLPASLIIISLCPEQNVMYNKSLINVLSEWIKW